MSRPLEDQLDEVMGALTEHRRKLDEMRAGLASRSATVRSRDRMVSVTVGPGGQVTAITFHTDGYAGMAAAQLARVLTETVQQAQAEMASTIATAMEPFRGVGRSLRESMVGGTPDDEALAPAYRARDDIREASAGPDSKGLT